MSYLGRTNGDLFMNRPYKAILFAVALMVLTMRVLLAQTSSPFSPPKERLGVYMINSGPGLDTGCTFRSGSPLIVRLAVPATMNANEINSDGTLKDPNKLTASSLLGATARIRFPVFDIDSAAVVPPPNA